jgi:hypothetical protein
MPRTLPPLDMFRFFEAAARHLKFTRCSSRADQKGGRDGSHSRAGRDAPDAKTSSPPGFVRA